MLNFLICILIVVAIVMAIPYVYFAFKDFIIEAYKAMFEDIKERRGK